MKRIVIALMFAAALHAQQAQGPRPTWSGTWANRPTSAVLGTQYVVTDDASVGACTGSGTAKSTCWWNGTTWTGLSGGGGTPGGSSGQVQVNSSGSFAGQSSIFSGGSLVQRAVECSTGTVGSAAVAALGAVLTGEITIQTGISGNARFAGVLVSESTQFTGTSWTGLTVSMGRPGGTTNAELTGTAVALMVSSSDANFWSARPSPPQLTGTYGLVLSFTSTGANLSAATAGSLTWEVCAYAAR